MKRYLFRFACVFSYWSGLDAFFYWLNRHAKRVLCFHHVLPDDMALNLPLDGFAVTASQFRRIVREVRRRLPLSVDIADSSRATITFDDGFLNQYEVAAEILRQEGEIPACLFVAGKMIGNDHPQSALDCDLLAAWATFVPEGDYTLCINGENRHFTIKDLLDRRRVWLSVLRPLWVDELRSATDRGKLLKALSELYSFDKIFNELPEDYVRLRFTGVSHKQLEDLRSRGWTIGWHTYSHVTLKILSREEREKELTAPAEFAKEVMAYPFGSPDAIDDETIEIASRKGYPCAFSYMIDPGSMMGLWFLPRMSVPSSKYQLHFELSGLKYFLRTRRLLPRFPKINA